MGVAWSAWWICLGIILSIAWVLERKRTGRLSLQIIELKRAGQAQVRDRAAERTGRVRAEV